MCMCVCPRRRKRTKAALRGPPRALLPGAEAGWAPAAPTNGPNGPSGGWSGTFVPRRGAGPGRGALPASSRCRSPAGAEGRRGLPPGAGGAPGERMPRSAEVQTVKNA